MRLREVYIKTISARGADPMIGPKLSSMFGEAGFEEIREEVVANPITTVRDKLFLAQLIVNMRETMVEAGAASAEELDQLQVDVEAAARDSGSVWHQAHIHQVSGRRPAS